MAEAIKQSLHVNRTGGVKEYMRKYENSRQDDSRAMIMSQKRNGRGGQLEMSTDTQGILMPDVTQ